MSLCQELVEDASRRNTAVAVHCLAGLGRAPVLVVIALIEAGQMRNIEAIELVRSKRKGELKSIISSYDDVLCF